MSRIASAWRRLFGARNAIDSAAIRRGDGVWEALTGGLDGAPSESSALAVSAVYACVNLIAGAIAALPMHVYRRSVDGDRERDHDATLWWTLNEEFCPRWNAAAGWSFLVGSRLLHGDAFAEIQRDGFGRVKGLVPLHPSRVRVLASPDGDRLLYEIAPDPTIERPSAAAMRHRVLDQDDVLHVPGFGFDGLRGLSPLRHALRVSGRLAIRAQDFSSAFLGNMGRPDFTLQTDQALSQEVFDRLQAALDAHAGPFDAGKPMILEGGLKVATLTMPLEEMQLLETRRFQVEEIARIYGVPPFMIGHTDKTASWGSGVESMGAGFVRFTLRDHLNAFQGEINRKFFRTARREAIFDPTELERADLKAMFDAVRTGLGRAGEPAIITLEEGREKLGYPRKMTGTVPTFEAPAPSAPEPAEEAPE